MNNFIAFIIILEVQKGLYFSVKYFKTDIIVSIIN